MNSSKQALYYKMLAIGSSACRLIFLTISSFFPITHNGGDDGAGISLQCLILFQVGRKALGVSFGMKVSINPKCLWLQTILSSPTKQRCLILCVVVQPSDLSIFVSSSVKTVPTKGRKKNACGFSLAQ